MSYDTNNEYECRQYTSEYLYRSDSVIRHASRLFSAGEPEIMFPVDVNDSDISPVVTATVIVLRPLLSWLSREEGIGDPNPYVPYYKSPGIDRNKLIVFEKWLVRSTYQQFNAKLDKELFYFIGAPLEHIKNVSFTRDGMNIYAGCEFGGHMDTYSKDKDNLIQLFKDLNSQNRLHPEVRIY